MEIRIGTDRDLPTHAELAEAAAQDELWDAYASSLLHLVLPDGAPATLRALSPFSSQTASLAFPAGFELFHVISAQNPLSVEASFSRNAVRSGELATHLVVSGLESWPALGTSPDGEWVEECFLIAGLSTSQARELGSSLGQVAVFEWSSEHFSILACAADRASRHQWQLTPRL